MKYLSAVLILALASSRAWASAPVNDNFASAAVITVSPSSLSAGALANGVTYIITSVGSTDFTAVGADANLVGTVFVATGPATGTGTVNSVGAFAGSNVSSTSETNEPVHGTVGAGNSVWWKWTATATGTVTIDTNGSSFDTVLAVYKGATVGALTAVAYDDDVSPTNLTSKVSFTAVQNTVYYIAVDGFQGGARGATGSIALHLATGPGTYNAQNDDYANRAVIAGEYAVETGSSELASVEPGENTLINSNFFFYGTVNSVWWTWTAPRAGKVTVTSSMLMNGGYGWANFYGELGLYSANGDTLSSLSFLSGDEGGSGTTDTPSVPSLVRTVKAGEVLQIRVADYITPGGAQITLTVSMDTTDFTNDHFAKRALLSGSSATASVSNSLATAQTGEPGHYEEVTAGGFVIGDTYMINSVGTTDFTAVGATSNTLGLEFTATGAGTGTGTALHLRPMDVQSNVVYTADQLEAGKKYYILDVGTGTTDFTVIGAGLFAFDGEVFTATGPGTGDALFYLYSGLLTVGQTYRIETTGTTDFTAIGTFLGTPANTPGLTFTATATGFGTGTVLPVDVITAGSFVIGRNYRIESVGTTDFTAIGATANTVGTVFQATDVGSGTGTASTLTASKSAWWSWVAPSNGYVSISTAGSTFGTNGTLDTLLKIYTTGNLSNPTLADIVPLASNDDSTTDVTSFVHFKVVKGTSYQIAVDSGDLVRDTGTINLGLVFTPDVPIITTQVQDETAYVGLTAGVFTVSNTGAVAVYDWQVKLAGTNTWVHYDDGVTTLPDLANGIATSTLTVPLGGTVTQVMNGDQYRCVISNTAGQVTSKAGTLTAIYLTTYQGGSPVSADLGIDYTGLVPSGATEVTYYASGLPSGLKIDPLTGLIVAGSRITAKANTTYTIKYWTSYVPSGETKQSKSGVANAVVLVNPFPAAVTGSFEGLLVDGLGVPVGKVSLLVNTSGAFTGTLMYDGSSYALRGALVLDDVTAPTQGEVILTPDKAGILSLHIIVKTDSTMTATLKKGLPLTLVGDVGADGVQLKTYDHIIPAPFTGTYTLALNNPYYVAPDAGPEGSGYGFATIDFKGVLHLKGKLADGTIYTALLPTDGSDDGQYRPYIPVYSNKYGYLSGWMPLSKRGVNSGLYHIATIPPIPTTGGSDVYWVKNAIPNDKGSYPTGFGPAALNVIMEPWISPTNSYLIGSLGLLTLGDSQTVGNFGLTMTQTSGVLTGTSLPTSLKMDALSKVTVLDPTNTTGFAFTITPKTGYFKGSFTLSDTRKVTFEGALLQLLTPTSGDVFGHGYFLVPPPLAPTVGTAISGDVQFTIP